jgi:type IV pilus assembly protein PilZ
MDCQVPDLRRYSRVPLDVPVEVTVKGSGERFLGLSRDISLGGMQLTIPPHPHIAFGQEIDAQLTLPGQRSPFVLPAIVRWARGDSVGVQFGLLGARETHAITELTMDRSVGAPPTKER